MIQPPPPPPNTIVVMQNNKRPNGLTQVRVIFSQLEKSSLPRSGGQILVITGEGS